MYPCYIRYNRGTSPEGFLNEGFLACFGLFLSVFPVMLIVSDRKSFKASKNPPGNRTIPSPKKYVTLWGVYGVIGLASFPLFVVIGFLLPLPQLFAGSFGLWLLGSGLIALGVLYFFVEKRQRDPDTWSAYGIDSGDAKLFFSTFVKRAMLAIAVLAWLVLWVYLIDWLFIVDFRVYVPFLKTVTLTRAFMLPIYLVFTLPFFLIEGMWIVGVLQPKWSEKNLLAYIKWGASASMAKLLPYLLLFTAQYLPTLIIGNVLLQGYIGFLLLFLLTSVFLFGLTTVILAWSVYLTGRVYSGAFLSAMLLSWSLATILPFGF